MLCVSMKAIIYNAWKCIGTGCVAAMTAIHLLIL
jgi:hypothetical protein